MKKKEVTKVTPSNIIDAYKPEYVASVEAKAILLYTEAERSYVKFAAELRRLQEMAIHLQRGFPNFGDYVESQFDGLNANTARQLSRQGQVLLCLEKNGRINLDIDNDLPKSKGVRALALIMNKRSEEIMLKVFDAARATGRGVTESTVAAALEHILPPIIPAQLGEGSKEPEHDELPEEIENHIEKYHEILDRVDMVRDCLYDITEKLDDNDIRGAIQKVNTDVAEEFDILRKEITKLDEKAI